MSNQEVWNEALKRTGQWQEGQRCARPIPTPSLFDVEIFDCRTCGFRYAEDFTASDETYRAQYDHDIPPPPVGDPAAVVKMLEWTAEEIDVPSVDDETGETIMWPERRAQLELWFGDDNLWHARLWGYQDIQRHPVWYLALAAAIVALQPPQS